MCAYESDINIFMFKLDYDNQTKVILFYVEYIVLVADMSTELNVALISAKFFQ